MLRHLHALYCLQSYLILMSGFIIQHEFFEHLEICQACQDLINFLIDLVHSFGQHGDESGHLKLAYSFSEHLGK